MGEGVSGTMWQVLREDWAWQSGPVERAVVITYRLRHWGRTRRPRALWRPFGILLGPWEFFVRTMFSGQISAHAVIGRRLRVPHAWGLVIHSSVVIGDDCTIYHQVTLGVNEHKSLEQGPRLADRVYVGAGAKVIGPITVGADSVVGANAVVLRDVPPCHAAVGVPAVCRPRKAKAGACEEASTNER